MAIDVRGEGAPLVLVGGGLTGWLTWIAHQEMLAPTRRVARAQPLNVQLGLEGRALPADYSVHTESRALSAGLDAAGLGGPLDVVAWSYGAMVALDFALDEPQRVRTLTLVEPPAVWVLTATGGLDSRASADRDRLKALHEGMHGDVSEEQLAEFLVQIGIAPTHVNVRLLPLWPNWVKHRRSLLQGAAIFAHTDTADRLRAFNRPALLIKGTGSSYLLHRVIDALAATLPHARVVELAGGHAPQLAATSDFLRLVADFHAASFAAA
jgi:pimeloyl-ACP methyl ester carboxylesterase